MASIFIGCGAGFAGDRVDASIPVVAALGRRDGDRYLMLETLAERTLALAQVAKAQDPAQGYNANLRRFLAPILAACLRDRIKIVSNFGGANPQAAGVAIAALAEELGLRRPRIGIVDGDDIAGTFSREELIAREVGGTVLARADGIVSANVYLGAFPIAEALRGGADIVVTGRVADPALALGPMIDSFDLGEDDWPSLAVGTLAGHLLECGAQVSGGYFADPGRKDVPHLMHVGYPIAEVDGEKVTLSKPDRTGGRIDRQTVTEQLLYEIDDPSSYLTPDVTLDISDVVLAELRQDVVAVSRARGRPRPERLKATVCVHGGLLAEAEISYAGINALERARLAIAIVKERMRERQPGLRVRADAIGLASVHADDVGAFAAPLPRAPLLDVRVRFAATGVDRKPLDLLLDEVEALYCAGPAGGGGLRRHLTARMMSASCLVERDRIAPRVSFI